MTSVANERGWREIGRTEEGSPGKTALHISWEMHPEVRVSYLSDSSEKISYMVLTSRSTSDFDPHLKQLMNSPIDFYTSDELVDEISSTQDPDEQGVALVRAGLGAPENPTKKYVHAIFAAMRSSASTLRMSGITAIGYAEWEQFLELLDAVSVDDSDADVRNYAKTMAEALRKGKGGRS